MQRFTWQTIRGRPAAAPLPIRTVLAPGQEVPLHDHGYAEVSWIEAGSGTDRDGRGTHALAIGTMALHRPDDPHALRAGAQGLVLVNVILALPEIDAQLTAWGLPAQAWSGHHQLLPCDAAALGAAAAALVADPDAPVRRATVIVAALAGMSRPAPSPFAACPDWLADACRRMEHPENFNAGVSRLVALCGRSREHVARELRRHAGLTPREVVAQARLHHAAALLITTSHAATTIALSCGWRSVTGFYAAFRSHFGLTPQRWRQHATRVPITALPPATTR